MPRKLLRADFVRRSCDAVKPAEPPVGGRSSDGPPVAPPIDPVERPSARILIVDDDGDLRELLVRVLADPGYREIEEAANAVDARECLLRRDFDLVVTDLSMPGESGVGLMQWARENRPGPDWIVLTGHGTMEAAVSALQLGAFDFLTKPIRAPESLRNAVRNALAHRGLLAERDRLHVQLEQSNRRLSEHVDHLREACRLLEEQADVLNADLSRAGIIQQALLPQEAPSMGDFHVLAHYRPTQNVGGDLYDVIRLDERHVALLVADAAGHGIAAAMLAVLFRSRLPFVDEKTRTPCEPRAVLRAVNRVLCGNPATRGLFLTAAYCLLDTQTGEATIASAGHPPLLWLRSGGDLERIFHTGPALGLFPDADFTQQRIRLERDDGLLFYSDGLYERFPDGEGTPSERIAAPFRRPGEGAASAFARLLSSAGPAAERVTAEDDLTALLLAATPGTSRLDNGPPRPIAAPERPRNANDTLVGSDPRHKIFSVQGRGDWTRSSDFYAECLLAIREERDVMLDLTLCDQLDSTFLGTIHQLCELADGSDVEFRVQGVAPAVENLFEELGMQNVIEHMVPCMLPLPTRMEPMGAGESAPWPRAQLMLRAHESLAALNERNRREFDPLLAQLRKEMEPPPEA